MNGNRATPGSYLAELLRITVLQIPGFLYFLLWFWWDPLVTIVPILMYRGLTYAALSFILHLLSLHLLTRFPSIRPGTVSGAVALGFAVNVTFLIVLPVTIDRSVTVFLLGQLNAAEGGLTAQELETRLRTIYVEDFRAVDRRLDEQIRSGNVDGDEGRFTLTPQGRRFIRLCKLLGPIFGADLRFVTAAPARQERIDEY